MYKNVKKANKIRHYMEVLELHTGATTVHWEDITIFISVVEDKIVASRVKHIGIPVCFILEKVYNGIFS